MCVFVFSFFFFFFLNRAYTYNILYRALGPPFFFVFLPRALQFGSLPRVMLKKNGSLLRVVESKKEEREWKGGKGGGRCVRCRWRRLSIGSGQSSPRQHRNAGSLSRGYPNGVRGRDFFSKKRGNQRALYASSPLARHSTARSRSSCLRT